MKAVVLGCGALGSLVAASLAVQGEQPIMYCRSRERVSEIRSEGIRVALGNGEARVQAQARLLANPASLAEPGAVLIVALRTRAALQLLDALDHAKASSVYLVQPSLALLKHVENLGDKAGLIGFYGCAWMENSVVAYSPGVIRLAGGTYNAVLEEGFKHLRFDVRRPTMTVQSLLWDYTAAHASTQPVAALLGSPLYRLREAEHARSLVESLAREVLLVADAAGVKLPRSTMDAAYELLGLRGCRPRMLSDIENRIPSEVEYLNGVVVREALRHGVSAAYNDAVYLAVKALEETLNINAYKL